MKNKRPASTGLDEQEIDYIKQKYTSIIMSNLVINDTGTTEHNTHTLHNALPNYTTHSTSNSILEHKRKSTSSKVKNLKVRPRTKKCKFTDTGCTCSERKYILCS